MKSLLITLFALSILMPMFKEYEPVHHPDIAPTQEKSINNSFTHLDGEKWLAMEIIYYDLPLELCGVTLMPHYTSGEILTPDRPISSDLDFKLLESEVTAIDAKKQN